MNKRQIILISILLFFAFAEKKIFSSEDNAFTEIENYAKIFGADYQSALNFMKINGKYFDKEFANNKPAKKIVMSFLFPERIRYSILKDYLETEVTENIYVTYGKEYVDFSIGAFQMKPSFVEKLETCVEESKSLKSEFAEIIEYTAKLKTEIRKIRVKRLKSFRWQLKYAKCFYYVVSNRFDLSSFSEKEVIEFLASAYNSDFTSAQANIIKNIDNEYFPYGTTFPFKQYSYAKIAAFYYKNLEQ